MSNRRVYKTDKANTFSRNLQCNFDAAIHTFCIVTYSYWLIECLYVCVCVLCYWIASLQWRAEQTSRKLINIKMSSILAIFFIRNPAADLLIWHLKMNRAMKKWESWGVGGGRTNFWAITQQNGVNSAAKMAKSMRLCH